MSNTQYKLRVDEVEQFREDGYLGVFSLNESNDWLEEVRQRIDTEVLTTNSIWTNTPNQFRHLDQEVIYRLCSHPAIVDRMASLFGPHLILWQSNIFDKKPEDQEYPWHQDINYWGSLEPAINISAWIAIDSATKENGCVQVIPGSHKRVIPHVKDNDQRYDSRFGGQMADPSCFDTSHAVPLILKPGEFFLFNERLLHYSGRNFTNWRRLGVAVRVSIPIVKIQGNYPCILLKGEDYMGFNKLINPPLRKHLSNKLCSLS